MSRPFRLRPAGFSGSGPAARPGGAFILFEVTLAIVILGLAAAVCLRSFVLSLHATRELEISLRATLLAQSILETIDLVPPKEGKSEGCFGDDENFGPPYRYYFYRIEAEDVKVDYKDVSTEGIRRDFVPLTQVHLEIWYDDQRNRLFRPVDLSTYVFGDDPFSQMTRQNAQLF